MDQNTTFPLPMSKKRNRTRKLENWKTRDMENQKLGKLKTWKKAENWYRVSL